MVNISGNNDNTQSTLPVTPTPIKPPSPIPQTPVTDMPVTDNPEDLDTRWTRWRCLVCNYTYEGREPLKKCPRCGNEDPDKFNDVE